MSITDMTARRTALRSFAIATLLGSTSLAACGNELASSQIRHPILDVDPTGSVDRQRRSYLRVNPNEQHSGVLVPVFRKLSADPRQLRFNGEIGAYDVPLFVGHDQLSEPAKLRVRYLSSIAVMPEASTLSVTVNGQQIATIVLDTASEPASTEISIPPGLLQYGYNGIRFAIQQRHRVDCSVDATNELWTQIDPAGTGIALISTNENVTAIDELIGIAEAPDGSVPITVVLPATLDLPLIDQTMRAVQALAIRADIQKPRVVFTRQQPTGDGLHLYVGLRPVLQDMGFDHTALSEGNISVNGRNSTFVRVAVTGDTMEELATAIQRLSSEVRQDGKKGTPEGLRALAFQRGAIVGASSEIPLSAFGISTQDFSGRVFRTAINLVLPFDFYPADNGKAIIFLDGGYEPGLLTSNEAIVRVNGRIVGATRLARSGGDKLDRRAIEITLSSLQPGYNAVEIEVRGAAETDKDCNPLSLIDSEKRLTIKATTSFALPRIAKAEFLPNLGGLASTGFPIMKPGETLTLSLPKPDASVLSASATLLARLAVTAGRMIPVSTITKLPDRSMANVLMVGALRDLPAASIEPFRLPHDSVPGLWRAPAARKPATATVDQAAAAPTMPSILAPFKPAATEHNEVATPRAAETMSLVDQALRKTSSFLQRNVGYSAEQLAFMNRGRAIDTLPDRSSVLFGQAQSPAGSDRSWLLLTGRSGEEIAENAVELVSLPVWQQIHGRLVAFDAETRQVTRFPVGNDDYIRVRDRSFANITLFAAGWLSNHIQYYVMLLLAVCGAFGFFSRKLLNRIGAKP